MENGEWIRHRIHRNHSERSRMVLERRGVWGEQNSRGRGVGEGVCKGRPAGSGFNELDESKTPKEEMMEEMLTRARSKRGARGRYK